MNREVHVRFCESARGRFPRATRLREREHVKFTWVHAEKANWPVAVLCDALWVSRSGYYSWISRPESARVKEDRRLGVLVQAAHKKGRGNYGSPRIHEELAANGTHIGRNRVIRIMRDHGLKGRVKKRFVRTTDSDHDQPVADNLLGQNFEATAPNLVWVGDVTYLRTPQGWLYLAVLIDLFSRAVVGWALSTTNDRWLALQALDMAVMRRAPEPGLIHHTDRGSPYASHDYQQALEDRGLICSMSRKGDCYDNAVAESWFASFKTELGERFESHANAQRLIFEHIEVYYNQLRRHSKLDYLSPRDFERRAAA